MSDTMATMGAYIVLAFIAGQFVAYFNETKLGIVMAVNGAELIQGLGFDNDNRFMSILLILVFITVAGFINLFIGSASAKWAIMAPVFVPQLTFRIADSTTNIILPLMPYSAIVIAFAQKYDKKVGIGTLISTMIRYSIFFTIVWVMMLISWIPFGIPLGPNAPIDYVG